MALLQTKGGIVFDTKYIMMIRDARVRVNCIHAFNCILDSFPDSVDTLRLFTAAQSNMS